ncbi:DnaD domain protein [Sporomusa termitida]|uniref:DnaB/C C-terminal domain-containing protein n=1 Tax=Sporomusa termitida TaxID=2377 RepID=A0A517DS70_9FIRM|nr:DnaD domain protein [Sporomusa termitida]QDR80213.1 hypothetical protein SPTER_15320 [Sporomusa termitida]
MNYAKLLNAFEDYSDRTGLPTYAQLIYYKLFALNNRAGWAEWFDATNPYVMFRANVKDEKTFIRHRNLLQQHGLIKFQSGKKGQPTRYKLIPIYENTGLNPVNNPVIIPGNNPVETPVNPPVKTPDIYKHKQKQIDTAVVFGAREADKVLLAYQNNIGVLNDIAANKLDTLTEMYTAEWVLAAIEEAVMANVRKLGFIESVLGNWGVNGFKIKPWEVEKCGRGDKSSHSGGSKQSQRGGRGSPSRSSTDWENEPDTL